MTFKDICFESFKKSWTMLRRYPNSRFFIGLEKMFQALNKKTNAKETGRRSPYRKTAEEKKKSA